MEGFRRSMWLLILPVLFCAGMLALSLLTDAGILAKRGFMKIDRNAAVAPESYSEETEEIVGGGIEISLTEPVTEDYFNDALFLGDSITSGLTIYDMFDGFNAIYKVGVSPMTATSISFTTTATGNDLTLTEAVRYYNPRKLYIMLGTNGINWASTNDLL
ncbi:MAG: SGNH/GDSL hydrolase family protein, partial [Oscillospiraceae bacterium]|nr:SGNH/GDSL hydrolase family protein [Oscillospiraceae bacterium]